MFDPGEIGLSREGKQVVGLAIGRREKRLDLTVVDPQLRRSERRVRHRRSACDRELANAIDGVVIVSSQEEPPSWGKRIRLSDVLERTRRVERKDRGVLARGIEPIEDGPAR